MGENKKGRQHEILESKLKIPLIWGIVILAAVGILLIAFSAKGETVAAKVVNTIGTTLLASSIVSIVLEFSSITSIVNMAIQNMLNGDVRLDNFSEKSLDMLGKRVAIQRSKVAIDDSELSKSVYSLEPQMLELINSTYYEHHNSKVYLTPDKINEIIHKKVVLDYEIINKFENKNEIHHEVSVFNIKSDIDGKNWENNFTCKKFIINNEDLTEEAHKYITVEPIGEKEHKYYESRIIFRRTLQGCKRHKVKLVFEYNIPITDSIQSFKLLRPAKRLEHTFVMKNGDGQEKFGFSANAFTSFYCNEDDKFKVEPITDTDVKIQFQDWIIPGAGYVVAIKNI